MINSPEEKKLLADTPKYVPTGDGENAETGPGGVPAPDVPISPGEESDAAVANAAVGPGGGLPKSITDQEDDGPGNASGN